MPYETLLYDVGDAIATITLIRPERLNTIVPPMPDEFEAAIREATRDETVEGDRRAAARGGRCVRFTISAAGSTTGRRSVRGLNTRSAATSRRLRDRHSQRLRRRGGRPAVPNDHQPRARAEMTRD